MATIRKLRGRWQAMVRRKGMAPRCKSFDSKTDAERWARSLESEIDRCGALPDTRPAENTTLAEVLTRYKDEVTPMKRSAISEVARINGILRRPICHRTLTLLSTADLASYRDERLKTVSPATVVRELNTISHAIDTARRESGIHLAQNPCKLVRRPSPPRGRLRRLVGQEEQILLAAADTGRSPYMRPLIVLAIETGMRRGELLTLDWKHVDLERRVAHLPLTKNGDSRDVPLSIRALETLRALRAGASGRVFNVAPNAVRLTWVGCCASMPMGPMGSWMARRQASLRS
jgi:integrase